MRQSHLQWWAAMATLSAPCVHPVGACVVLNLTNQNANGLQRRLCKGRAVCRQLEIEWRCTSWRARRWNSWKGVDWKVECQEVKVWAAQGSTAHKLMLQDLSMCCGLYSRKACKLHLSVNCAPYSPNNNHLLMQLVTQHGCASPCNTCACHCNNFYFLHDMRSNGSDFTFVPQSSISTFASVPAPRRSEVYTTTCNNTNAKQGPDKKRKPQRT